MTMVPSRTDQFTTAIQITEGALVLPYRQSEPITTSDLAAWLAARGTHVEWTSLHRLWLAGVILPVAVLEPLLTSSDHYSGRFLHVEMPGEVGVFADVGVQVEADKVTRILHAEGELPVDAAYCLLWHPYQLWFLHWLLQTLNLHLPLDAALQSAEAASRVIRADVDSVPSQLVRRVTMLDDRRYRELLALLLHAEPLVHDMLDSRLNLRPQVGESLAGYREWRESQTGGHLLTRLRLEFRHVEDWYRQFLWTARIEDPVASLRPLLRHMGRRSRERLTGAALLAHNLYDLADVLRAYMERYQDESLPDEDEVFGQTTPTPSDQSPLRDIAREFDVDPQARATWFVEGATEKGFIRRFTLLQSIDLEFYSVAVMDLGGVGNISTPQFRELLERLAREETFSYASVDKERVQDHIKELRTYARSGWLTGGFKIWDRDFEEANFSLDELAEIANDFAAAGGVETALTAAALMAEQDQSGKAIGAVIERLWHRSLFYGGKGEVWGEALANWTIKHACPPQIADQAGERPIVTLINRIRTFKGADFRLSRELQLVNEEGELVQRS